MADLMTPKLISEIFYLFGHIESGSFIAFFYLYDSIVTAIYEHKREITSEECANFSK